MMAELARWLSNPLVLVGLCAIIGGGLLLFVGWAFTGEYERGGRESVHRRPRQMKPWHREPTGEQATLPQTQAPARHRLDTVREETTNLGAYVDTRHTSARSRVVMIGEDGLERGDYPGTTRRVRQAEKEHGEEEGSEDRERRQDEGRTVEDGEEGGSDTEAARPVGDANLRWFRNTVTGEIVMVNERGERIDWDSGE